MDRMLIATPRTALIKVPKRTVQNTADARVTIVDMPPRSIIIKAQKR